ncbi:MAG: Ig-like domain-containing protein [Actinomycetota bacterium]
MITKTSFRVIPLLTVLVLLVPIAAHAATVEVHPAGIGVWRTVLYDGVTAKTYVAGTTSSGTHGEFTTGPATPPLGAGSFHQHIGTTGSDGQRVESSRWADLSIGNITQLGYSTYETTHTASLATAMEFMVDVDGDGIMTAGIDEVLRFDPKNQNGSVSGTPNQCSGAPGCVATASWQTWNALDGAWEDNVYQSTVTHGFVTLLSYAKAHPLAQLTNDIPSVRLTTGFDGSSWAGFDGNFDAVAVQGNTFDFEDPPAAPIVSSPVNGATFYTQNVTISGTLTGESGAALSGATVSIVDNNSVVRSVTTSVTGSWSTTMTFPDGFHTLNVTGSNGGYTGPTTTLTIGVIFAPVFSTPVQNSILHSTVVTTTGLSGAGKTIDVYEGSTHLGSTVTPPGCTEACHWSVGPFVLPEGLHTISATTTDSSGTSQPSHDTFTIDITPVITSPTGTITTHTPVISGTAGSGMTITVMEGSTTLGTTTTSSSCSFPCAWSIGSSNSFADGTHTITATATEGSQTSSAASDTFTVNTSLPPAPVIVTPAEGAVLTSTSVNVSGTSPVNATIKVYEGSQQIGTTTATSGGSWNVLITFSSGSHAITATETDSLGNVSPPSSTRSFSINAPAPNPPIIVSPPEGAIVRSPVAISGTAPVGTNVTVFEGSITFGTVSVASDGSWTISVPLVDGAHRVTAFDVDSNGTASRNSNDRNFTVDSSPPTISVAKPVGYVGFIETGVFAPLDLNGSAQDDTAVTRVQVTYTPLLPGGSALTEDAQCDCPAGYVVWSDVPPLDPGVYRVAATATDAAGNVSVPARTLLIAL